MKGLSTLLLHINYLMWTFMSNVSKTYLVRNTGYLHLQPYCISISLKFNHFQHNFDGIYAISNKQQFSVPFRFYQLHNLRLT